MRPHLLVQHVCYQFMARYVGVFVPGRQLNQIRVVPAEDACECNGNEPCVFSQLRDPLFIFRLCFLGFGKKKPDGPGSG